MSDIVSLPKLDDSYVLQSITNAEEKRDVTVGQLHTFDLQQTTALQNLEYTVQAMIEYIQLGSNLFQSENGSIQTVDSIFYNQAVYKPRLSLYTYSLTTLNQLGMWNNFYLNYVRSNPAPKIESPISVKEGKNLRNLAVEEELVIDQFSGKNEVSAISGNYYTLSDGRILREYKNQTGVYQYTFVDSILENQFQIEELELEDVEVVKVELPWGPGNIIKFGKAAKVQLSEVKNALNPDKAKSFAKDLYDDYIKKSIEEGYSTVNGVVKKINDLPVTKNINESISKAKETFVQMPGKVKKKVSGKDVDKIPSEFSDRSKLEGHFDKHGEEFNGLYKNADEYLEGAKEVINYGIKVKYEYKGEIRTGYVNFMGNNKNGKAKFEFVGTNNNGDITTYHTQSGKKIWKTING